MKKNFYAITLLITSLALHIFGARLSFAETDADNSFAGANAINAGETKNGSLANATCGSIDLEDYYRTLLKDDGTVRITVIATNTGSVDGVVRIFSYTLFDPNVYLDLTSSEWIKPGETKMVVQELHCMAADSLYFKVDAPYGCSNYTVKYELISSGISEGDGNDNFDMATPIKVNESINGRLKYGSARKSDPEDYYRTLLPDDGMVRITLTATNTGAVDGVARIFSYTRKDPNVYLSLNSSDWIKPGETKTVVQEVYCMAADSFYFKIDAPYSCNSYTVKYELISTGVSEGDGNDNFDQATPIEVGQQVQGRLKHSSDRKSDNEDYYRTLLPDDGTVRITLTATNTGSSDGVVRIFSHSIKDPNLYLSLTSSDWIKPGETKTVVQELYCMAKDSLYFRIDAPYSCNSYTVSYEVISTGISEGEGNDSFDSATPLEANAPIQGRLKHGSARITDNEDYYRAYLADDGSIRITVIATNTGSTDGVVRIFSYSRKDPNVYLALTSSEWIKPGEKDTIVQEVQCMAADSFYVRVDAPYSCSSYSVLYEPINHGKADIEPNNTISESALLRNDRSSYGRINYSSDRKSDPNDFYKFDLTSGGPVWLYITSESTNQNSSALNLQVFTDGAGNSNILNWSTPWIDAGQTRKDTVFLGCLNSDSLYFRISGTGCISYQFRVKHVEEFPEAAFDIIQFGNDVAFTPHMKNADKFEWNLAGETSTKYSPSKTFPIGLHQVTLKAIDTLCDFQSTATKTVKVDGIESYSPKEAGSLDGLGYFNLRLFGAGLDTLADITLTQGNTVLTPFRKASPDTRELTAMFTLRDVPTGMYDLKITLSGGLVDNFPQGFRIFEDTKGFNVYSRIKGATRIRNNRWNNYTVDVYNDMPRMANGVILNIVAPRWAKLNIKDITKKSSGKLVIKGDMYKMLSFDPETYKNVYYDGDFDPNRDIIEYNYDLIYTNGDSLAGVDIDQLFNKPYEGTVYPIYIPMIGAKSVYSINFQLNGTQNGELDLKSYVTPWTVRDNPLSGDELQSIHDAGIQAAAVAELAPNPALKLLGKTAGYIDIGSQILFAEMFDQVYGTNVADQAFYGRQGVQLAGELVEELIPFGDNAAAAQNQIKAARRSIKENAQYVHILEETILNSGKLNPGMAKKLAQELADAKDIIAKLGPNITAERKREILNGLGHVLTDKGSNLTSDYLSDLLFPKDPQDPNKVKTNKPDEINDHKIQTVTSMDPNAIYGNPGSGEPRYIRKNEGLSYTINFENIATASAPAQMVRIADTLDPNVFDLSGTFLGDISFGGKFYQIEDDRQEYFRDIDLRPSKNLILRVMAKIDAPRGLLYWEFVSLDPSTMDIPIDPDAGFLPPNVNFPQGEGSVSFTTRLKSTLANMDTASTFATIYFDENEPIATNQWKNTIDDRTPSSRVSTKIVQTGDTLMTLSLIGEDSESGPGEYGVYVKIGEGPWSAIPIPMGAGGSANFIGTKGTTYSFYSVNTDNAGNLEIKEPREEATVTLGVIGVGDDPYYSNVGKANTFSVYPNPADGVFSLFSSGEAGDAKIEMADVTGKKVFSRSITGWDGSALKIEPGALPKGMYFININSSRLGSASLKIILE